jgi:hypothetical protein
VAGFTMFGSTYLICALVGTIAIDTANTSYDGEPSDVDMDQRRKFGTRMTIPGVGPFLAIPVASSATGSLFSGLAGATQVAGLSMGIAGAVLLSRANRNMGRFSLMLGPEPGGATLRIAGRF